MRLLAILSVLLLGLAPAAAHAQFAHDVSWRVQLSVTAPDDVEEQITGFLSRQLISIPDVHLAAEGEADFEIVIVATRTRTVSGMENGFALSVAIIKPFSSFSAGLAEALELSPEQSDLLQDVTSGVRDVRDLWIRTGSGDDLGRVLQQIVMDFDQQHVEEMRRRVRQGQVAVGTS
ncbi:MAG TPA: hypothetical protein VHG93_13105 [Longimicrobium sp.]|nr:hypothetical protein [Longimicrobium sp.]